MPHSEMAEFMKKFNESGLYCFTLLDTHLYVFGFESISIYRMKLCGSERHTINVQVNHINMYETKSKAYPAKWDP